MKNHAAPALAKLLNEGQLCVRMSFIGLHGDWTMNVHRAGQPTTLGQNPICTETVIDEIIFLPTGIQTHKNHCATFCNINTILILNDA
jgi:hypothetical protein